MGTQEVKLQNQEEESKEIDELEDALSSATKTEEDLDGIEKEEEDEEVKKEAEEVEEKPKVIDESRELKQIIRQQAKDLAIMRARLGRMEKKSVSSKVEKVEEDVDDIFKDESTDKGTEAKVDKKDDLDELSNIEVLERAIKGVGESKGPLLDTLLETMEQNPQYKDIREVCSQAHFDDIFDAVGKAVAEKEGVDPIEASLEFELSVWSKANPYKYMYDVIKKYHSEYAEEESEEDAKSKRTTPAKAPTSIAGMGGGDRGSKSGWTAERIDNLPEDELDKVPPEVYDKYLAGELD